MSGKSGKSAKSTKGAATKESGEPASEAPVVAAREATTRKSANAQGSGAATRIVQVAFVAAAVAAVSVFAGAAKDGEARRSPESMLRYLAPDYQGENRTAPDFELSDRNGRRIRLSSLRGKTVVLHFWSRTCPPCIEELQSSLPAFDEMVRGRNDVALVLVTVDANWEAIAPLVPANMTAPVLFDPERRVVGGRYGTRLFPETWVIDPRGVIRARFDHTIEWASPLWMSFLTSLS